MRTLPIGVGALLLVMGCAPIDPAQNTFPQQPQPVSGPPGGGMDPGYGYAQPGYGYPQQQPQAVAYNGPDQPGYPQGYAPGYPDGTQPSTEDQAAEATANGDLQAPEPSADPNDAGYDMGQVDDAEIDATLDGYGTWEESEDYGRVWRPDTTAVGVDFTPYETCGSWIWSDAGWNFSCDYSWGWLPFHYGRWGWFDGYWGWQPGYAWSTGAVEWRGGGGYTGWRPLTPNIRDHRGEHNPPNFHDHRHEAIARDSQWRFTRDNEFGRGHIRGHLFQNPAEGLRATAVVSRPSIKANYAPVSSASIMRARLGSSYHRSIATGAGGTIGTPGRRNEGVRGNPGYSGGYRTQPSVRTQAPIRGDTPTWRRPETSYRAPAGYRAPQQPYRAPSQSYRPTYRPPATSGGWSHSGGGGYQRPSYTPSNSGSWSHSSGGGGGGYSRPSAPSHSSGGGGGSFSHSSGGGGGGGHSSGGGRHR
ncbi:MAG TPA: DUF6600 domain-containing protein [Kofleriaceae bacterium]|nr:DUF6600 domain-containing protein [Kofleriaceae bacterium]